jgi:methyl-accepting chemotaxis protein PixJ
LMDLLKEIVEAAVQTLDVERASVWFYNADRSAIRCVDLYERMANNHSEGIDLSADTYPGYFKALATQRVIAATNAHTHPATQEFSEEYLTPLGINSILNAQIQGVGMTAGVLCCEKVGPQRQWTLEEQTFITSLSEAITLAIQSQERERAEAELRTSEQEQREKNESLQRELLKLLMEVESASDGDLTVRADVSAGEIGIVADFFNAIIESMRDIVSQVKQSAAQVNTSLSEDEEAMGALAQESLQQTQKIQQMLESVEQMALSIQEVANNARQAAKVARTASSTAQLGGEAMDRTVDSILQLRETVADTSKKVKQLGESSQQISKVVSLINQIALQTNLLAINASIEAARAGEEGRGFAVVAEEVGALAAQSAAATKDIEKIVESIQYSTSEVVDAMERGTTQVVEGSGRVEEAKLSLGQIIEESRQIDELVQSISEFTVSQTQTSERVKTLMQELTQSAALSSESSDKVSHSIRETAGIAAKLQVTVDTFKVVAQ